MSEFSEFLKEQMRDPAFQAEYDALESEFSVVQAVIENGNGNPS